MDYLTRFVENNEELALAAMETTIFAIVGGATFWKIILPLSKKQALTDTLKKAVIYHREKDSFKMPFRKVNFICQRATLTFHTTIGACQTNVLKLCGHCYNRKGQLALIALSGITINTTLACFLEAEKELLQVADPRSLEPVPGLSCCPCW